MNIFYFIATPSALHYLPLIKVDNILYLENENAHFNDLKALFEDDNIFLDKDLSLRSVSLVSGLSEITIRKLIKSSTQLNFNDFVNKYRIDYAITVMKSGFLNVNLITALGEKSGFKSNHTFYRAFKKLKHHTPSNYYKKHLT
jgi:YesN/AraC family two-component response regulator|tara:strand:- start:118 stop:546 length:429 start_codon:yes stop_codon:yes gene_type:complete